MKQAVLVAIAITLGAAACHRAEPAGAVATAAASASASTLASSAASAPSPPADPCRVEGGRLPSLARWTKEERAALGAKLRDGIAVLAASACAGTRLLAGCNAKGRYGFHAVTPVARAFDLADEDEVKINAPATSADKDPKATPRRLVTTRVALRRTTRALLTPSDLVGACDGATHFVTEAEVGAIAATTLADGAPPAIAAACKGAKTTDASPPAGCDEIVVLRTSPIAPLGEFIRFDQAPDDTVAPIGMCPSGFAVAGGRCTREPVRGPHLCSFGDGADCRAQCDAGDINSCDVLAFMHRAGKGVAQDAAKSVALYRKGCDANDAIACASLGDAQLRGEGAAPDKASARTFYDKACDLGELSACGDVAALLDDAAEARAARQRACDAGAASSCVALGAGDALSNGEPERVRGRAVLDELCGLHVGVACTYLAQLHFNGRGVPADHARTATLLEHACRAMDPAACDMLGVQYRQGDGVPKDDALATRLIAQACQQGAANGCLDWGVALEHGKGVPRDLAKAASLYERACSGGIAAGCHFYADNLTEGSGVPANRATAAVYYAKACTLGDAQACAAR
ncbi:MAG TPA: tetratricopeptide repeat protein [Byssovorax sp.]|jgi:hypothetical protein